jgi:hypothetical protein
MSPEYDQRTVQGTQGDTVTDVLLDIYEVRSIVIWFHLKRPTLDINIDEVIDWDVKAKLEPLDLMEAAVMREFQPRWNRAKARWKAASPKLTLDNCDLQFSIISDAEAAARSYQIRRIEAKLLHLLRAVRKASVSGHSRKALWGLRQHSDDLVRICEHGDERTQSLAKLFGGH